MTIAFLIMRSPEYRVYAPVIEAALARGWNVECWHDHGQLQTGLKAYQFPATDSVPAFRHGQPVIRTFAGPSELRSWLAGMRADVVVAWQTPEAAVGLPLPAPRPFWVAQQYHLDSFVAYSPKSLLTCDLLAAYSRWWLEWAGEYFQLERTVADGDAFVSELADKTVLVGLPEMDAARQIDPAEVRRRWGIPADQPVVVLFPFPQGVGRDTFWPKRICGEPSPLKQLAGIVRRGRFEYLPHVWRGWNDANVVRALRRFCDRNGARLLVKSRLKTPIPDYTAALADQSLYDERFYPATVLEALSIASLSVGYYTTSVFESVSLGVPHVCVTYAGTDYNGAELNFFRNFYSSAEGSAFQFGGVTTAWSIPQAIARLPESTLGDFAMDPAARSRYMRTFLDHDAGDGGRRVIDAIDERRRRAPAS